MPEITRTDPASRDTMGRADGLREASERLDRATEAPTTGPEAPTGARQAVGTVTDAMVQAAIGGALDLVSESFPGPDGQETHRAHDAYGRISGGYHSLCPFCRLAGAPESVAGPARERVFRAALEAAVPLILGASVGKATP